MENKKKEQGLSFFLPGVNCEMRWVASVFFISGYMLIFDHLVPLYIASILTVVYICIPFVDPHGHRNLIFDLGESKRRI